MESGHQTLHYYLIKRSKAGDRQAQAELYKLYAAAMYNICRRMLGDEDDAKDVLQDAFIDAFVKLHTLKEEAMFTAWIKRIVVNKCINALKKKQVIEPLDTINEWEETFTEHDDQDKSDYVAYEAKKVLKAIDRISDGCKVVLNLYLFEGYDHKEIAQILGITESGSKAQYSKAKKKIRHLITTESV